MKKYGSSILVTLVVILMIFGIYRWSRNTDVNSSRPVSMIEDSVEEQESYDPDEMGDPVSEEVEREEGDMERQVPVAQQFSEALQQMSECFEIRPPALDADSGASATALEEAFTSDFGSVIFREEEWTTTDIRLPSGEGRRLFVQSGIGNSGEIERRLKYYSVGSGGELTELSLTPEQQLNPTETLLASLESDGSVTAKAQSRKVFTQNGAELHVAESQGQVYSFEVLFEGRSFSCPRLSDCSCL